MFWKMCGCSEVAAVILDRGRVFWIRCGCSGVFTVVLVKVRVFRIKCLCSGVGEDVLGVGAGVLEWERLFSRGCRCSR